MEKNKENTYDLEIRAINFDLMVYFEILCKKTNTNIRKEIINFMDNRVKEALENNVITQDDKNNFKIEIEEY